MYYVFCENTGEDVMCDTKEDAIKQAKSMIQEQMHDDSCIDGSVLIMQPVLRVLGNVTIDFNIEDYKGEESDTDLSITKPV